MSDQPATRKFPTEQDLFDWDKEDSSNRWLGSLCQFIGSALWNEGASIGSIDTRTDGKHRRITIDLKYPVEQGPPNKEPLVQALLKMKKECNCDGVAHCRVDGVLDQFGLLGDDDENS